MRFGVDFGTTRIVVSVADRGNYPLVGFEEPEGLVREWYPPLVAFRGAERLFGWDTWRVQSDPDWTVVRSFKRMLKHAGPNTTIEFGGGRASLRDVLVELVTALRDELYANSTLNLEAGEPLEIMLGVPANANSNQRFLTAEAFRAAGFTVLGILNEPSAASIEYAHLARASRRAGLGSLLVYDLGGGTFDASLVEMTEQGNTVIAATGIEDFGGDDFDEILAALVIESARGELPGGQPLTPGERFRLLEECREKKEMLNPNTRKITVDLDRVRTGWGDASIPVGDFYERCRTLIEESRDLLERVLERHPEHAVETLYVTGGGAELPPVARILKETFGRRVRRSAYMRSATAIGLAIAADTMEVFHLRDRLTRNFGVWREARRGADVTFDLLLPAGAGLPAPGEAPLRTARGYHPVHNVGYFRYAECTRLGPDAQPLGDITAWDEIRFPFEPSLSNADLTDVPVTPHASGQWIEEEYTCDASGHIRVTISNRTAGYRREYNLGRWSDGAAVGATIGS